MSVGTRRAYSVSGRTSAPGRRRPPAARRRTARAPASRARSGWPAPATWPAPAGARSPTTPARRRAALVVGAHVVARDEVDLGRQRCGLRAQRHRDVGVDGQPPQHHQRALALARQRQRLRERQPVDGLGGIVVAGRFEDRDRARRIVALDRARLDQARGQLARTDALEDRGPAELLARAARARASSAAAAPGTGATRPRDRPAGTR